jgi:hypothetical protein
MARKLRVEYSGAIYHLMSRRDRREPIFLDDDYRQVFCRTLAEVCVKTGWRGAPRENSFASGPTAS